MHEKMRTLLKAYLDGELHGRQLLQLETHLADCAECRDELTELQRVSELLQQDKSVEVMPVERFVANLTLSLPRRAEAVRQQKRGSIAWWLVPAGLLGAWFFVQTVFTLTDLVTAANITGLLGSASAWLGGGRESIWMSAAANLFGGSLLAQPGVSLLNSISVFSTGLLSGLFWQAVIVLLYWAWLFVFWLRHKPQAEKVVSVS